MEGERRAATYHQGVSRAIVNQHAQYNRHAALGGVNDPRSDNGGALVRLRRTVECQRSLAAQHQSTRKAGRGSTMYVAGV